MEIKVDDLNGVEIAGFLKDHLFDMSLHSPTESIHALDLKSLQNPDITFWSVWDKSKLVGCGALKEIDPKHAEIKSMRTESTRRREGVASHLLRYILKEAKRRSYQRVSLETGSMDAYLPARKFYEKHGFQYCEPFADYIEDPNSVFMTIHL